jgi:hypothetical protein
MTFVGPLFVGGIVLRLANKRYRMQVREMKWGVCKVAMAMVAWFFPSPFLGTFTLTNFLQWCHKANCMLAMVLSMILFPTNSH